MFFGDKLIIFFTFSKSNDPNDLYDLYVQGWHSLSQGSQAAIEI